jgi:beta-glucosidase
LWFLGSELGNGLAGIMLGEVNTSARLPVSFPIKLKHNPSYGNFLGENGIIHYDEGLLVGYRHYTIREVPTLFPFGYGLSYTIFTYSALDADSPYFSTDSKNRVTLAVKNSGILTGDVVIQLYVSPPPGPLF